MLLLLLSLVNLAPSDRSLEIPFVKIINGYEDGAKSVNPDIEVQTAWTNSFVDTQLAQEAAKKL